MRLISREARILAKRTLRTLWHCTLEYSCIYVFTDLCGVVFLLAVDIYIHTYIHTHFSPHNSFGYYLLMLRLTINLHPDSQCTYLIFAKEEIKALQMTIVGDYGVLWTGDEFVYHCGRSSIACGMWQNIRRRGPACGYCTDFFAMVWLLAPLSSSPVIFRSPGVSYRLYTTSYILDHATCSRRRRVDHIGIH